MTISKLTRRTSDREELITCQTGNLLGRFPNYGTQLYRAKEDPVNEMLVSHAYHQLDIFFRLSQQPRPSRSSISPFTRYFLLKTFRFIDKSNRRSRKRRHLVLAQMEP